MGIPITMLALLLTALTCFGADHKFGWKSNPTHSKGLTQFVHHPGYAATPIKVRTDLRAIMPHVYDQGPIGACVTNSAVACFEKAHHDKTGAWSEWSRLALYYDCRAHDGNSSVDSGTYTASALYCLAGLGIANEKLWPYETAKFAQRPPFSYYQEAKKHRTIKAYDVDATDHKSLRIALSKGFPIMFGGSVYQSIEELKGTPSFNAPAKGRSLGGHERVLVGHDDTLKHTYPNGITVTGFYLVRNSWGEEWGDKGYCWEPKSEIENPRRNSDFAVIEEVEP